MSEPRLLPTGRDWNLRGSEASTTGSDLQAPYAEDKIQDPFQHNTVSNRLTSGS